MSTDFFYPSLTTVMTTFASIDAREQNEGISYICKLQLTAKICQTIRHNLDMEHKILPYILAIIERHILHIQHEFQNDRVQLIASHMLESLRRSDSELYSDLIFGTVNLICAFHQEFMNRTYDKDQPVHSWCVDFLIGVDDDVKDKIKLALDTNSFSQMYSLAGYFKFSLHLENTELASADVNLNLLLYWVSVFRLFYVCINSQFLLDSLITFTALFKNYLNNITKKFHDCKNLVVRNKIHQINQLSSTLDTSYDIILFEDIITCLKCLQFHIRLYIPDQNRNLFPHPSPVTGYL